MNCIDFEYDGRRLSDFNSIICCIDGSSAGITTVSVGSQLTLNTVKTTSSNRFKLVSTQYDSAYTTTFEIGKYVCSDPNDKVYTEAEIASIMRWLNRKVYKRFTAIYDDNEFSNIHYYCTFNDIQTIKYGDDVIGFSLTLTTDSPYGYYNKVHFETDKGWINIIDNSDETGTIYPLMRITCKNGGTLQITNSLQENSTKIENCVKGEIITFDGDRKQIYSSVTHDKLYNDFNYVFPEIVNDYPYVENAFTITLTAPAATLVDDPDTTETITIMEDTQYETHVEIEYSPISKVMTL